MAVKKPWGQDYPNEPTYPSPVDQAASNDPNAPLPSGTTVPPPKSYEQILAERKAAEDAAAAAANPPPATNPPGFDQYGQPKTQPDPTTPTATTTPDTSAWDTGGYAKPAYTSTNYNQTAVSGYDPAKWTNPAHQTPKYVVGRILSSYNLNDPTQLQAAMADIAKAYPGTTWAGRDVVNIPGIGPVDIIRDFGGQSGIAWQPESDNPPAAGAMTGPLGSTSALASSGTSSAMQPWMQQGTPTTPGTTGAPATGLSGSSALDEARRTALLELLNRQPPTAEDLQNSPENQAYQLQAQRAEERGRAQLAETAAFEGFDNTGYYDTELRGIQQQRGEGEAGFLGDLAVSRMQAQREDLQFAISEAQQAGQFDLAQQLL